MPPFIFFITFLLEKKGNTKENNKIGFLFVHLFFFLKEKVPNKVILKITKDFGDWVYNI